jgi:SPP1 gp7 family putative phage head morphogenesis protein|tara:strand:- start:249 stop:2426 length:2178 start_codon:yes stop_codon:yes gene_type:complete
MNVNEKILDTIIGDAVDIQRYEATVQRQILKQLKDLEGQIVTELKNSNVITAVRKQTQDKRLTALLKKTRNSIGTAYKAISKSQTVILSEVAELSELQTVNAINKSIKADLASSSMSRNTLNAIASNTLIEGSPTKQWWSRKAIQFQNKFEDTVRMGMMQGQTTDNIVRSLIGTKVNKYKDGALTPQYRGAEAVTRSSIQTVANTARLDTYQNNSDIIKGIEWSSTFDNRTSQICMALDGLQWDMNYNPIGHSKAFVGSTAHWNCRSTQVPITKSWEELGSKVKVEVPVSTRASMDGQVAGGKNYEQWLGTKSKAFQVEVLGVEKQKLWKAGKIGFTDLVNQRGNPLTLAELQNKIKKPVKVVKLQPVVKPIPKPKPKLVTTKDIQTSLTIQLAKNAKDSRYILDEDGVPLTRYRARRKKKGLSHAESKRADFKAQLDGLTNEAAELIKISIDEATAIVNKLGIQGIRGVVPNIKAGNSIASMGDGVMSFSKKWFNKVSSTATIKELEGQIKNIIKQKDALKAEMVLKRAKYEKLRNIPNRTVGEQLDMQKAIKEYNATVASFNKLADTNVTEILALKKQKISKWKFGDDIDARPWTVNGYVSNSGLDQMRTIVFHEFGHHVHNNFLVNSIKSFKKPPLEGVLESLWYNKDLTKSLSSKYQKTNSKEWFAENFAIYNMGRKDLVDPILKDLIDKITASSFKNEDDLYKWLKDFSGKKPFFDERGF